MPDHHSWLNFVPGFGAFEHAIEHGQAGWLFGSAVHVQHIAAMLLVVLVMLMLALAARGGLQRSKEDFLPDANLSARNMVELLLEGLLSVMQFTMTREKALKHVWLIGTLGLFILFSNLLGLIPGFLPPTENFNTTFACATMVFVYYNFYAFKNLGLGHLAHMANPVGEPWGWFLAPLFLPVEIISHFIRPLSLSMRLFCNIAGDHLVMAVFVGIFPLILPVPFVALGTFVALLQTFVFILLSCVYIGEVEANIAHHHEAHHGHGHGAQEAAAHH